MKRNLLVVGQVFLLLMLLTSVSVMAQGTLVYSESFENSAVGNNPTDWTVAHPQAGIIVDSSFITIPDGSFALQLNNLPDTYGQVTTSIPEIAKGKLMVDFYQPSAVRENINLEVHNSNGRIAGVFLTQSGNIRVRDEGIQSGNMGNLPNDNWHTLIITWDNEIFTVSYLNAAGQEVLVTDTAKIDPAAGVDPANKILFNVSQRDDAKEAYIDNVRVYNLGN